MGFRHLLGARGNCCHSAENGAIVAYSGPRLSSTAFRTALNCSPTLPNFPNCSNLTGLHSDAKFRSSATHQLGDISLKRARKNRSPIGISRRKFLQYCQGVPLAFLPSPLSSLSSLPFLCPQAPALPTELHVHPQYRVPLPNQALLRQIPAGFDQFPTEKYQDLVAAVFSEWSSQLLQSPQNTAALEKVMPAQFSSSSPKASQWNLSRDGPKLTVWRGEFVPEPVLGRDDFLAALRSLFASYPRIITAEFQVISIRSSPHPLPVSAQSLLLEIIVRFEFVALGTDFHREQRVGHWQMSWELLAASELRLQNWNALDESRSRALTPIFVDVANQAFGGIPSYTSQLVHGTDHWRTVLDGACGIDIYGHNGVSAGDMNGDGFDDLYICQPAGLPNRLFRNRGDGTFEDLTEDSGLGVLENTACALFADVDNDGRQDLIVVRANGPLLFLNVGSGKFRPKPDAFQFANPPQGTFTGAAIADYDRDGWLDIYFCLYSYYQGAGQYRYPMPYFDAENGPPNFMMRNNRNGTFEDVTKQTGLHRNNTRFSFCCAWGDFNGNLWPDLVVVNDFGRKNLYRNNGDGTFTDIAKPAGVEDVGAGMSVCSLDFDNDGREDLYIADMWTAPGIRISEQPAFQNQTTEQVRSLYRKHALGNSLFRNTGSEHFEDLATRSGTAMGRWSWCSDSWDFDQDGFPDLYIANGMISGPRREDLNSFFWRQVVANSPQGPKPNHEYEQGWNAINDLIRSDWTWSGCERNAFFLNNRDGTFSDVSGIVGLDAIEDSRTFALADFDHDGRLEVLLKNRSSPQLRLFKNVMPDLGPVMSFRLSGKKSNPDAIGASVTIETTSGRQTRHLQAGSGFLAQHSKELFFALGAASGSVRASIHWPSGVQQNLPDLPPHHRIWVEEGSPPSRIEPFASSSPWSARSSPVPSAAESLPVTVETWLLAPVHAPEFSLPERHGQPESLSVRRGKPVLLYFWSASSASSRVDLEQFEKLHSRWATEGLQLLTINLDATQDAEMYKQLESFPHFSFPVLIATQDLISVYNLLYRYLFDRHRDLSLPTSFLLDKEGAIVKIYQGAIPSEHFGDDFKNIPRTDSERLGRALPFSGLNATYDFGRNYLSLGSVFFERGYPDQAEAFFRLALQEDPTSAEAIYGIGSVYLQQRKNQEARESFERSMQLHASYPGTMPNAWNNLGILSAREGNTTTAIEYFQRALEIDATHPIALLNLGNAYRQQKDWGEAKLALQKVLDLNPDDPEANYSLGMVYAQQDDPARAYDFLKKALALRPTYPEALNNLGVLCLRTHRPQEAIASFEESIRVAPAYDQSYLNLGRVYVLQGDKEKARAVLLELLKQHPEHPQGKQELLQLGP
jgi:tetratricopeptide (TPR) repeat protein